MPTKKRSRLIEDQKNARRLITDSQKYLNTLGFETGRPDGLIGQRTRRAMKKFQASRGMPATGNLTVAEFTILRTAAENDGAPLRRSEVQKLQANLNRLGFGSLVVDGYAGAGTRAALNRFRQSIGQDRAAAISKEDYLLVDYHANKGSGKRYASIKAKKKRRSNRKTASSKPKSNSKVSFTRPTPTRAFAGPNQYPPKDFRGYGILAFKSTATDFDRERHQMICQAYAASYPETKSTGLPVQQQFLTIWPVNTQEIAIRLNAMGNKNLSEACKIGIEEYSLLTSTHARNAASLSGFKSNGAGPFLFAWSPATRFGTPDSFVLSLDLSSVQDFEQAQAIFQEWRDDIETDFELLRGGFSFVRLKTTIRRWADKHGTSVLQIYSGKK